VPLLPVFDPSVDAAKSAENGSKDFSLLPSRCQMELVIKWITIPAARHTP